MLMLHYLQIYKINHQLKTTPVIDIYFEDNGFEKYVVRDTGAMVRVKATERPSINVTEDGLLECRYHPYNVRQKIKAQMSGVVNIKKIGPNNRYSMMTPDWALFKGPCFVTVNSNIIAANPDTGDLEIVNDVSVQ